MNNINVYLGSKSLQQVKLSGKCNDFQIKFIADDSKEYLLGPKNSKKLRKNILRPRPRPRPSIEDENLSNNTKVKVYITRTGSKYHLASCSLLGKNKKPISLEDAVKEYEPCKICKP